MSYTEFTEDCVQIRKSDHESLTKIRIKAATLVNAMAKYGSMSVYREELLELMNALDKREATSSVGKPTQIDAAKEKLADAISEKMGWKSEEAAPNTHPKFSLILGDAGNGLVFVQKNPDWAVKLDKSSDWYGWLFYRHPDGQFVSFRQLQIWELNALNSHFVTPTPPDDTES